MAVISRRLAAGGPTMRGQKYYANRLGQVILYWKSPIHLFLKIETCEAERGKIPTPHDDSLVIESMIANLKSRRIFKDIGSSSNIIGLECLSRLKHNPKAIEKIHYPIIGFGGGVFHLVGIITPSLCIGNKK